MKLLQADLWSIWRAYDAICITTNGCTTKAGDAVMGKGIALDASIMFPSLPRKLGGLLTEYGNRCFRILTEKEVAICSFPTKGTDQYLEARDRELLIEHHQKIKLPAKVCGWQMKSSLPLIEKSCREITEMADKFGWKEILIPFPGINNGGLDKATVLPVIEKLDDRFTVIYK